MLTKRANSDKMGESKMKQLNKENQMLNFHPECHHAWLIRRIDKIYSVMDNYCPQWKLPGLREELRALVCELRNIEQKER